MKHVIMKRNIYLLCAVLLIVGCVSITRVSLKISQGAAVDDTTPVLSWELSRAMLNGSVYVYVDENKNAVIGESATPISLGVDRNSVRFGVDTSPLKWNKTYYWKVKAVEKDSLGAEIGWYESDVSSFTTPSTPVFSITSPASGDVVDDTVRLSWNVSGRFNEVAVFQVMASDTLLATSAYFPDVDEYFMDLDLSGYHNDAVLIRLRCVEEHPHGETVTYESTPVKLLVFGDVRVEGLEPSKGMTEDIAPALSWSVVNKPPSDYYIYEVVIATSCDASGDPATPVITGRVNTESMKVGEDSAPLEWGNKYYWQVRMLFYNSSGEQVGTLKSSTASFETREEPKPLIVSPESTELDPTEYTVNWVFNGTGYVSGYEVLVDGTLKSTTTTATSCVIDFSGYSGNEVNVVIKAIEVYNYDSTVEKRVYESDPVTYKIK